VQLVTRLTADMPGFFPLLESMATPQPGAKEEETRGRERERERDRGKQVCRQVWPEDTVSL
jgi:hypothetical protein